MCLVTALMDRARRQSCGGRQCATGNVAPRGDLAAPSLVAVLCAGFTLVQVAKQLAALPDASGVNDLHVSSMSTTDTAMTADSVTPTGHRADPFRADLAIDLQHRLGIEHTTLQTEFEPDGRCALTREDVV